jgi:acyl-coenzyme A thioesterase PaaI-like protein
LHLQAVPGGGAGKAVVAHARLGSKACGHPHIVHGGALASLLDDAFGVAFFTAKLGSGFTANLSVDYRRPLAAGTDIVVRAAIERVEVSATSGAKKVFLVGSVCDAASPATVYTEARALFIVKAVNSGLAEATVKALEAHDQHQQLQHQQQQHHQQHHQPPTGAASSGSAPPAAPAQAAAPERLQ